jgi:hypothetical protein
LTIPVIEKGPTSRLGSMEGLPMQPTPKSNLMLVRVPTPSRGSVGLLMSDMRIWLDHQGIQPTEFKMATLAVGNMACDVEFRDVDQAALFRAAFVPSIELTPSIFPQI